MGKNTQNSISAKQIPSQEVLAMRIKPINPKFKEPNSNKFDPNFNCWLLYSRFGGYQGYLMEAIDDLSINTNVSDYNSKSEVIDACLKHGYFG